MSKDILGAHSSESFTVCSLTPRPAALCTQPTGHQLGFLIVFLIVLLIVYVLGLLLEYFFICLQCQPN